VARFRPYAAFAHVPVGPWRDKVPVQVSFVAEELVSGICGRQTEAPGFRVSFQSSRSNAYPLNELILSSRSSINATDIGAFLAGGLSLNVVWRLAFHLGSLGTGVETSADYEQHRLKRAPRKFGRNANYLLPPVIQAMLVCKLPTNTALLIRFTSQNGAVAVVAEHWATRGIPREDRGTHPQSRDGMDGEACVINAWSSPRLSWPHPLHLLPAVPKGSSMPSQRN
jgi:hypothetical protein